MTILPNQSRRQVLAGAAAGLALAAARGAGAAEAPFRLVYFENFPPLSWMDGGAMRGIFVDLLQEALGRRLKLAVTHGGHPWTLAQDKVRRGEADAFCSFPTEERLTYSQASGEPVMLLTFTLFTRPDHPRWLDLAKIQTLAGLKGLRIAHYVGSGWARQKLAEAGLDVDFQPDLDSALRQVAAGKADVTIDPSPVIRWRLRELGLSQSLEELPQILDANPFHLCVGKSSAHLGKMADFDRVMREIRSEGVDRAVRRAYS